MLRAKGSRSEFSIGSLAVITGCTIVSLATSINWPITLPMNERAMITAV